MTNTTEIAIIGGGCSGLMVALQLLRRGWREPITIVEPREDLGRGLAYSTRFDEHLLNVPAGHMSALPAQPSHFVDWLRAHGWPAAWPGMFAPRRVFGDYLGSVLAEQWTVAGGDVRHVRAEALRIERSGGAMWVALSDGGLLKAAKVVLALGNPPTGSQVGNAPPGFEDRWHASPWSDDALRVRTAGERILLVGAGLTAVDAALALHSQNEPCRVFMLSRSGTLPRVHATRFSSAALPAIASRGNIREIVRELRDRAERAQQLGLSWQSVVDALRPISNAVWHGLPLDNQRRFMRHLKTHWETHRSRMAPMVHQALQAHRDSGRLEVIAGRVRETRAADDAIDVRIALRAGGERALQVDRVIHCTGIHEYYHERPRPLIADLMRRGLAMPNELGIGFCADEHGGLVGPANRQLFTLGPPRRGDLFETIAVPEIRVQAEALAEHLMSRRSEDSRVNPREEVLHRVARHMD